VTHAWADTSLGHYLLAGFVERGRTLEAECIAQVFQALMVSDLMPKLSAYRTATLIVNGEHDNALPGGTRTAALITHAEHKILLGTGHCCFIEDPERFNALVQEFLARHHLWPPAA
jgi:pimeloyl-ACP methyl ester carboxylesterase